MHEVVLIAVRNAVSAATITFTASSITLCFFILESHFLPQISQIIQIFNPTDCFFSLNKNLH